MPDVDDGRLIAMPSTLKAIGESDKGLTLKLPTPRR